MYVWKYVCMYVCVRRIWCRFWWFTIDIYILHSFIGGVDLVQYFTTFKVESASAPTYNESMVGQVGNPSFKSTYNGHEFHFLSNENKNIFEKVEFFLYVCICTK